LYNRNSKNFQKWIVGCTIRNSRNFQK